MNLEQLTALADEFIYALTPFHLIGFGVALLLFFTVVVLAILTRKKPALSFFLLLLSMLTLLFGPVVAYMVVENTVRSHAFKNVEVRQYVYQNRAKVTGLLANTGKYPLKECRITAVAVRPSDDPVKKAANRLKPYRETETLLHGVLQPGEERSFTILVDNVRFETDLTFKLQARCR